MAKKRKYLDNGPDGDPIILPVDKNGIPVANLNEVEVSSKKLPLTYSDENVRRYTKAVADGQIKLTQIPNQKLRNAVRAQPILNKWASDMNKSAGTAAMLSLGVPASIIGAAYLKGPMNVIGNPASTIANLLAKRGIISASGYASNIAKGADILYNAALSEQGIENFFSGNGVKKTITKIKEGDTLGALKSGAIDALDLLGGISLVRNTRNFFNKGKFLSSIKFPRKKVTTNTEVPEEITTRYLNSPEITTNNVEQNITSRNNTNNIGQEIRQPSQQIERSVSEQQPQRIVHTLENLEENGGNKITLEDLLKAQNEHSEAVDNFNLAFDEPNVTDDYIKSAHQNVIDKERNLRDTKADYMYNVTKDIDFYKPLESQIDFDKIPNSILNEVIDNLKYKLTILGNNLSDDKYFSILNKLSDIKTSHEFDLSGYKYIGRRNHPDLLSGETTSDIKRKMMFYLDEANDPRYFGEHSEKFDGSFSIQSKPMITGAITELSKTRRKNAQLPVRVSWIGKGRTRGNHLADLTVDGVHIYGSGAANGPTDVNTVLKQNIKRELDFYDEFSDQLGVSKEKIQELKKAFKDGTMTPEDFSKIKTDEGNYMFTVFDKRYNVGRYPSIRIDFMNGGSLRRSLKNGGIYIKPSHRGRFTALKERTGHSATWFKENGTPAQRKMATFALNAAKWKH